MSYCCPLPFFVNSEIEGEITAMVDLKEDDALKKAGLYNVGQTVTCFVKKVRSESS